MSKPTPGRQYTVVAGDTLSHIAAAAYGDGTKWRRIWKANQHILRSGKDPSFVAPNGKSGADLIFPGEVIFIPGELTEILTVERAFTPDLPGKEPHDFTIVVDGTEVPVMGGSITRIFDSAADGWVAELAWEPGAEGYIDYDEILKPFQYKDAEAYLGGKLMVRGRLYGVERNFSIGGYTATLTGWSHTADAIDSTIRPPYEQKKVTLEQRAKELLDPLGIPVVYELDSDEPFPKITASETETVFDHLLALARQRGAILTCSRDGEVVITKADTETAPVGALVEGIPPLLSLKVNYDGRSRFSIYRMSAQIQRKRKKKKSVVAIAKDAAVPSVRTLTVKGADVTVGTVQSAVDWERSKRVADSMAMTAEVSSWYAPETDDLWEVGSLVTVVSPVVFAPEGFNYLIREVTFNFSEQGMSASLSLVPPQAYTGEEVDEPWQ